MMRRRASVAAVFLVLAVACAKLPADVTPDQKLLYQANEAVLILGTVQRTAIGLNAIERCEGDGTARTCTPIFSDDNTRKVVDAVAVGVQTIRKLPDGWKPAASAALKEASEQLDSYSLTKLKPWLDAAAAALGAL